MGFRIFKRFRELLDVDMTSVSDGDAVLYDSATSKFIAGQAGGTPTEWTVGAGGQLTIAPSTTGHPYLEVDAPTGAFGAALAIRDEAGDLVLEVQSESGADIYARAANIAALDVHSVADADDGNPVFRVRPDLNGGHGTVFQVNSNGHCVANATDSFAIAMLLIGAPSQVLAILEVQDVNGNKLFQVTPDGNIHIKTGGTVIADL